MRKLSRWGNEIQRGPLVSPESISDKLRFTPESAWPQSPQPMYLASVLPEKAHIESLENCMLPLKPIKWQKLCPERLLWRVWRRLLWVPWTARRSNQSILKEINLNVYWEDWCWSWSSNTLATWYEELTHWKRPWCWERLRPGGEGVDRGWDGWMASLTQWTWIWENSGRWWRTGKPVTPIHGVTKSWTWWATEQKQCPERWCPSTRASGWNQWKVYQRLQKHLSRVQSTSERGGHEVCVISDTDVQEDSWGAARIGVAHNWHEPENIVPWALCSSAAEFGQERPRSTSFSSTICPRLPPPPDLSSLLISVYPILQLAPTHLATFSCWNWISTSPDYPWKLISLHLQAIFSS